MEKRGWACGKAGMHQTRKSGIANSVCARKPQAHYFNLTSRASYRLR